MCVYYAIDELLDKLRLWVSAGHYLFITIGKDPFGLEQIGIYYHLFNVPQSM